MTDFLLELRSEEIPARMQAKARDNLARLFAAELARAGLTATATQTYATPRRLALIARGLPDATAAISEEVKGPRTAAPPQALDGFLRKTGLTRDQLTERDGVFFAVSEKPGRATAAVLAEAIPAIVRGFPWPKSMRWGDASISTDALRWVRPLHGIVALFGEELVPVEVAGPSGSRSEASNKITSGYATLGHRFHHPGPITIGSANDYVEKLRACHVLVDQAEREALIRDGAHALAVEAGLTLVEDEGLVIENAGLTEWPVPLLGRFDPAFLDVPPEVIQLTARVNQKYFVMTNPSRDGEVAAQSADGGGSVDGVVAATNPPPSGSKAPATSSSRGGLKLAPAFICTANIAAPDGGARIVEGNRKVLAARLSDARFFYEQDLRVPLEEQAKKLDRIVFHEKLGTVADKVERVAKLARWLVEEGIVGGGASPPATQPAEAPHPNPSPEGEGLADLAERAARLCKADLVTGMVAEFPELQGIMGGYYALAQGEDPRVAAAVRDHYKPVGQGDEVPTAPVTVAVSLADKLDSLLTFFGANELPTGSRDPYALRRGALAVIRLIEANGLRVGLLTTLRHTYGLYASAHRSYDDSLDRDEVIEGGHRVLGFPIWFRTLEVTSDHETTEQFVFHRVDLTTTGWEDFELGFEEISEAARYGRRPIGQPVDELGDVYRVFASLRRIQRQLLDFFADRLKVQQREAGVRHDLIDAVFALGGEDDLVRLLARVRALQSFMATEDGANLLTGYRRAANILKKEGYSLHPSGERVPSEAKGGEGQGHSRAVSHSPSPDLASGSATLSPEGEREKPPSYTPEPAEEALIAALDSAEPRAASAVAAEEFEGAMAALATLRAPIDAFFDTVTVNDPDVDKRAARLALLARIRDAVHTVADFAKIEG